MKPYVCHICSKGFNGRGNLNIHMRIHTGERPYKCKICDRAFKTEGQIRHHLISHFNNKPFQCPHCSKFYKRKGVLKAHMLIHMDEPSFVEKKEYYYKIVNNLDNKCFTDLFDSYVIRSSSSKSTTNSSIKEDSHIDWKMGQQIKTNSTTSEILSNVNNIKLNSFVSVSNNGLETENLNIIQNNDENNIDNSFLEQDKSSKHSNSFVRVPKNQLLLEANSNVDIFQNKYVFEIKDEKNKLTLSEFNDDSLNINYLLL